MLGKKGQESVQAGLMVLSIILAAVGVGLIFFFYVSANADNSQFWKNFYAKDIALTMDASLGANKDLELFYKQRNNNYDLIFEIKNSGVVNIFEPPSTIPSRFIFATNQFFSQQQPQSFRFTTSFPIKISENKVLFEEPTTQSCNFATTTDPDFSQEYLFIESIGGEQPDTVSTATQQYLRVKKNAEFAKSENSAKMKLFFGETQNDFFEIVFISHRRTLNKNLACIAGLKLGEIPDIKIEKKEVLPGFLDGRLTEEPSLLILIPKNSTDQILESFPEKLSDAISQYYE